MLTMSACSRGKGEHALASAPDDERWSGPLHRSWRQGVAPDLVVLAVEVERAVGAQQPVDHRDRLLEPVHPDSRSVVGQTGVVVVGSHPAGAQAQFEAPFAEHVKRGRLLGQHEGMAVVVAEDQRTHAQRCRGRGHSGQGRDGRQLVAEVIGHEQRAVAEVLGLACLLGPALGRAVGRLAQLCGEAELAIVCHGFMLPQIRSVCPRSSGVGSTSRAGRT